MEGGPVSRFQFQPAVGERVRAGEWARLLDGSVVLACPECGATGLVARPDSVIEPSGALSRWLPCPGNVCEFSRPAELVGWSRSGGTHARTSRRP